MRPFKNAPLAIALIALSLLCACAAHKPPPRPGSINAKVEQLSEMSYLQVTDLRAVKRNHLLTVQVEINNSDSDNQQLYYRFKWLDADGKPYPNIAVSPLSHMFVDGEAWSKFF